MILLNYDFFKKECYLYFAQKFEQKNYRTENENKFKNYNHYHKLKRL